MMAMILGEPVPLPSLDEVVNNVALIHHLPLGALVALRQQLRHLDTDLDAAILKLIGDGNHQQRGQESAPERLLTPEVAATRFGVKKRWLLDHADEIPGVKRLSRKTIRFSERRLARFLERTTA
jgi:hypothetical protein